MRSPTTVAGPWTDEAAALRAVDPSEPRRWGRGAPLTLTVLPAVHSILPRALPNRLARFCRRRPTPDSTVFCRSAAILPQFCHPSAAVLPMAPRRLPFVCRCSAGAVLPRFCHASATVLAFVCRSAAVLPLFCRGGVRRSAAHSAVFPPQLSAAILPQFCLHSATFCRLLPVSAAVLPLFALPPPFRRRSAARNRESAPTFFKL